MSKKFLCPIFQHAKAHPEKTAIISDDRSYSYQDLDDLINGMVQKLPKLGVVEQGRAAFFADFSEETIALFFALFRMNVAACPITFRLPDNLIEKTTRSLDANVFLSQKDLSQFNPIPQKNLPYLYEDQTATLLFTSGSASTPKIAVHSLKNYIHSAECAIDTLEIKEDDISLLSLPLFHVGGLGILFRTFLTGSTVVITKVPLLEALLYFHVTRLSLVPTQLFRLLKNDELLIKTLSYQLRSILVGGAFLDDKLFEEALSKKLKVMPTYGMTEMSSLISVNTSPEPGYNHAGPYISGDLKINADGEVMVKGKSLFLGYFEKGKGVFLPLEKEGYFATKDIGEICEKKNLKIVGRKDNLFISGGENIQPEEIEKALLVIPNITAAYVVPIFDEEFGMRPFAFIECQEVDETSIKLELKKQLPSFKVPVKIVKLPDVLSKELKVSRKELALHAAAFLKDQVAHPV